MNIEFNCCSFAEVGTSSAASTSGTASSSRRRPRDGRGGGRRAGRARVDRTERAERQYLEEERAGWAIVATEEARDVRRPRFPRGPGLRADFAEGWDGRELLLSPSTHISHRVLHNLVRGLDLIRLLTVCLECLLTSSLDLDRTWLKMLFVWSLQFYLENFLIWPYFGSCVVCCLNFFFFFF